MPPHNPLTPLLTSINPILLDGALATQLEALGSDLNDPLWSASTLISNPSLIYAVHLSYYLAGADVAITASYQASPLGLAARGIGLDEAKRLIKRSVELAQRARKDVLGEQPGRRMLIAGSVGPYGAYLADGSEYRGEYHLPEEEMKGFHRERVRTLVEAGVDLLACETMPSFGEIRALLGLLQEVPETVAWVSMTLRDGEHLSDGTPLEQVVEALNAAPQVIALGVNCVPEDKVTEALRHMAKFTDKPLVAYPNSGEEYDPVSKTWHGDHLRGGRLQDRAAEWYEAGAKLIGGCCRTTPEDIRTLRDHFRA